MVAIVRWMDRKDLIGYPRFSRMVARVRKIDELFGIVVPEMVEMAERPTNGSSASPPRTYRADG